MSVDIHPSSVIGAGAELGEGVVIGPFCVVDGGAKIGARTVLRSHVVIGPHTEIGEDNDLHAHCTLGMGPQDVGYKGEPTRLVVGNRNILRESCTLHRATTKEEHITSLGDDNFLMVGVHLAHDCRVGNKNIMANNASLAGHVRMGSFCTIAPFSAVHQFCRVGDHAFMGGYTTATMDVLPFMKTAGTREAKSYGVNTIGLKRKGFSEEAVKALQSAHRILFHSGLLRAEAMEKTQAEFGHIPEVAYLLDFIRASKRGIIRG